MSTEATSCVEYKMVALVLQQVYRTLFAVEGNSRVRNSVSVAFQLICDERVLVSLRIEGSWQLYLMIETLRIALSANHIPTKKFARFPIIAYSTRTLNNTVLFVASVNDGHCFCAAWTLNTDFWFL